jgi:hypothetical protein
VVPVPTVQCETSFCQSLAPCADASLPERQAHGRQAEQAGGHRGRATGGGETTRGERMRCD